ncbi:MAG: tRNA threonylcarbamoyladenosine biosynthesis protein TsaE [Thiomicrorhabdus sp.]|nr:MAG: tRNA threonylcarbamoyladenosine biosynthesis protein TsaE [Thiomicrorhabdus sp.]
MSATKMGSEKAGTERGISHFELKNEQDTAQFAQAVSQAYDNKSGLNDGLIIYLEGDLGAGKSFFSRAFIQQYLPGERVKSPTYTIVESYQAVDLMIHHFDLYRIYDTEELEYLAIKDLFIDRYIALVEWPQKGAPIFPKADILIDIHYSESLSNEVRKVDVQGLSVLGQAVVEGIEF